MMDWYYVNEEGQKMGPVSQQEFDELVSKGTITQQTKVWNSNYGEWKTYGNVTGVIPEPLEKSTVVAATTNGSSSQICTICNKDFSESEMISFGQDWVCASCKPIYVQHIKEGAAVGSANYEYGGFWIRVVAKIIDSVILYFVNMIFMLFTVGFSSSENVAAMSIGVIINLVVQMATYLAYNTWFIGAMGATPGKMALGLKVITENGGKVSFKLASGRYLAEILSGMIFLIGYIMVAFDDEKRALHDRICETRVVKK